MSAASAVATSVALMGIRHHGPGSARSVVKALDELQPDAVLVEFPADAQLLLPWVARGLVPPVALLGHVVDQPDVAAFWPLASFSPEWQAFRWALAHGVELRAIDLPLAATLASRTGAGPTGDEQKMAGIDPIAELAAAAGDTEPERWWEDVIEHRGDGAPAFEAVAEAMGELRRAAPASSDAFEARREAHMREAMRSALADGFERLGVVCGAWHVPALDIGEHTSTADRSTLRAHPRAKVAMSWIPWTHQRLDAASGYRAGIESPGWYAHVFEHPGADGVNRFLVDAARFLRTEGFDASPDHLIGASRLAEALAVMRGRPRPGLAEVLDAADSVFADHRRGTLPGGVMLRRRLVIGDAIGEVPDDAPQVPLARDLAAQQRRCRLRPSSTPRRVELDLRTPSGRARSQLLHRSAVLGLRGGRLVDGRGSSGTFRETWELVPQPEDALRVVESSALGTTLLRAATSRCIDRARTADSLTELEATLHGALRADLPDAVGPCLRGLSDRGARDPDLGELIDTLGPLADTIRYGDVRDTDQASVRQVFDGFVDRVLAGMVAAFARPSADAAPVAARRVAAVHAALALCEHPQRDGRWRAVVAQLADADRGGLVAGRAARVLHDAGWWSAAQVEKRLSRALSVGTPPECGATFVEGFLAGSGTVLIHDAELLAIIDTWLCGLNGESFEQVVPLLRRTFGGFEPAERRQIGWVLTDRQVDVAAVGGLDPERLAQAATLVGRLLGLPGAPP